MEPTELTPLRAECEGLRAPPVQLARPVRPARMVSTARTVRAGPQGTAPRRMAKGVSEERRCLCCGKTFKNNAGLCTHVKLSHATRTSPLYRHRQGVRAKFSRPGELGVAELEVIQAMDEYRRVNQVHHIPARELVAIFHYLGYRKTAAKADALPEFP